MTDLTDASIQVRISRKTLATLAMWFHEHGDTPRSLSALARNSMEILREFVVRKEFVPQVTSTLEATKALERIGLGNLSVTRGGERLEGKYLKQMQIDDGILDLLPSSDNPFQQIKKFPARHSARFRIIHTRSKRRVKHININ